MEQFYGTFVSESHENLDDYFKAKGINWMLRKVIITAMSLSGSGKRTIKPNDDGSYNMTNEGSRNNFNWNFKLNEPFEGMGFDGKKHEVTMEIEGDKLLEHHTLIDDKEKKDEYWYKIEGEYLIWAMLAGENNEIEGKWKMKKTA